MVTMEWRVATRKRTAGPGWDIGHQPMLRHTAEERAEEYNARYRAYEHKAVRVPSRLEAPAPRRKPGTGPLGGPTSEVPPRSPELGKEDRR